MPVEYLLIDVPVATPVQPMSTFTIKPQGFPIENRPMEGHLQDFAALAHHRQVFFGFGEIFVKTSEKRK